MDLRFEVLRDALIFIAKEDGVTLAYNASPTSSTWNWNQEAVNEALGLIDYIRITGQLPSGEEVI